MQDFFTVMARISLPVFLLLLCMAGKGKQRMCIFPEFLQENVDYKGQVLATIYSDYDTHTGDAYYSLKGAGASEYPFNVFVVDSKTGEIYLNSTLDREIMTYYEITGVINFKNGTVVDLGNPIPFSVEDENDNPPVFGDISPGFVDEESPVGTTVMKITATDADEPGTWNSEIAYTIVEEKPPENMFSIKQDGTIILKSPHLDREKTDQYVLIVKGQDLDGRPWGLTGTGTVTINIRDVNDNPPTLEKEQYDGSIEENTYGMELMTLKAEDLDQEGTPNWEAVFDIVKGNEAGYFSIKTDPKTNEGILMLNKPVDYEDVKDLNLGITVRNVAPPHHESSDLNGVVIGFGGGSGGGGSAPGVGGGPGVGGPGTEGGPGIPVGPGWTPLKIYPVKINVKKQPEGPRFEPTVEAVSISEGGDTKVNDVTASYPALNGDTGKPAENVLYTKFLDPDNWLAIDPTTAEIKLNKKPDRESPHLVNDTPSKTATGTIALQVKDFNDHCPTLTGSIQTICTTDDVVIVNAEDEDDFPNSAPFHFNIIPEGTQGKWKVEHLNDTAAILRSQGDLWPGEYEVKLVVTDMQGHGCPDPQKVKVQVCTCEDGVNCGRKGHLGVYTKSTHLGPTGIGMLFLGLLLLLFILLLALFCRCGRALGLSGFADIPFDTKSHLINYHTEGRGENTAVPLMNMPTHMDGNMEMGMASKVLGAPIEFQNSVASMDAMNGIHQGFGSVYREGNMGSSRAVFSEFEGTESRAMFADMALPEEFLEQYYTQKPSRCDNLGVKDSFLEYDYEGQGSAAGSMGYCSSMGAENDLKFLNDLKSPFKTLAEVYGGKISTEVKPVITPLSNASINTEIKPVIPPRSRATINTEVKPVIPPRPRATINTEIKPVIPPRFRATINTEIKPVIPPRPRATINTEIKPLTPSLSNASINTQKGMVLVNGTQTVPTHSLVVQGQTMMDGGQAPGPSMVLVDSSQVQGPATNLVNTSLSSGTVNTPPMFLRVVVQETKEITK